MAASIKHNKVTCIFYGIYCMYRDHFVYTPSQWETTLHCNVVSHWLRAFTKWSLHAVLWSQPKHCHHCLCVSQLIKYLGKYAFSFLYFSEFYSHEYRILFLWHDPQVFRPFQYKIQQCIYSLIIRLISKHQEKKSWQCLLLLFFLSVTNKIRVSFLGNHPIFCIISTFKE